MDVAVFPPCYLPSGKTGPVPPPETPGPSLASLVQSPTGHQSQISRGFSVPLPDPQVGKSAVGPRTFLTVQEFPWCNCSAFCGSSAQQFCGGANGDLLQESLCYMLHYTKSSSDNHFAFLHFFFFGMVLLTASCTVLQTSVHSSSGTLFTRSNPLNLFLTCTVYS